MRLFLESVVEIHAKEGKNEAADGGAHGDDAEAGGRAEQLVARSGEAQHVELLAVLDLGLEKLQGRLHRAHRLRRMIDEHK